MIIKYKNTIQPFFRMIFKIIAFKKITFKKNVYINSYCKFNKNTVIKNNCHFNGMRIKGGGNVTFGNNFHSGQNCLIITDVHNYNGDSLPYGKDYIIKNVCIEDNVWIGDNVLILGGIKIGEGAIIQAGSVVSSDVKSLSIVGGNPAKEFKKRCSDRYEFLKAEGKFI